MNIEPKYVTFEQAKLIKGKGFNYKVHTYFQPDEVIVDFGGYDNHQFWNKTSRPEQWQVVEWLRVNHGIWVYADFLGSWMYVIVLLKDNSRREIHHFNSPQESYSAAFDYVLKELI